MTGRHARRPAPDMQTYWDADDPSDLPGRPARYDPALAAQARAGLTEQARRQRLEVPGGYITAKQTITDEEAAEIKRRWREMHGKEAEPTRGRFRKPGRWARLTAWLAERFTPVKEDR